MTSREFIHILLNYASDETLDQLLQAPGLQFLYPLGGLVWVDYRGRGLANYEGALHSFDPSKIQGVRFNADIDKVVDSCDQEVRESVSKETHRLVHGFNPKPLPKGLI